MEKELAFLQTHEIDSSLPLLSRLELKIKNCGVAIQNSRNRRKKHTWICEVDSLEDAYQNRFECESYPRAESHFLRELFFGIQRNKKMYVLHNHDVKLREHSGDDKEKSVVFSDYTRELAFKAYNRKYSHLINTLHKYPVYCYGHTLDEKAWMLLENLIPDYSAVEIFFTFGEGQFYLLHVRRKDEHKDEDRLREPISPCFEPLYSPT